MAVNSMFKCKEFSLAKVNEVIFKLQDSSHTLAHGQECIYLFKQLFSCSVT